MKISWLPRSLIPGTRCAPFRPRIPLLPPPRSLSTSTRLRQDGIAAPQIKFPDQKPRGIEQVRDGEGEGKRRDEIFHARIIPQSPSYFTARPNFTDDLLSLKKILAENSHLPVVKPGEAPRVAWVTSADYKNISGELIKASKYQKIIEILHRLNQIHPAVMPPDVKDAIIRYKRSVDPYTNVAKPPPLTAGGVGIGSGRRKSASASAQIVEGRGEIIVNGKTLAEAFGRYHDRESVIWALKATDRVDKYNVWAKVVGGGTTGQAEALTLAIAKALMAHEPALKPALRRAGCVTRDPRRVERKKPGHVKARKMPAWVKR